MLKIYLQILQKNGKTVHNHSFLYLQLSICNRRLHFLDCICKSVPDSLFFFSILILFVQNLTTLAQLWFFFYMKWKQRQMCYYFKMQKVVPQIIAFDWNCNFCFQIVQTGIFFKPHQHVKNIIWKLCSFFCIHWNLICFRYNGNRGS